MNLQFLGLLNSAREVLFGEAIYGAKHISLLLLAKDASKTTKDKATRFALSHRIPLEEVPSKAVLGAPLGREELSLVAIKGENAAKALLKKMGETN